MEFTEVELEILERAFNFVNDWSAWDDEEFDFETEVKPAIKSLKKKIGFK